MNKSYKYRIYPTEEQKTFINKTIGCCRLVYNELLQMEEAEYKATGKGKVYPYTVIRNKYDFMKEVDAQALNAARRELDTAFKNYFDSLSGKRKGPKMGRPTRRRRTSVGSYTTYISNCKNNKPYFNHGRLALPKMKEGIQVVWHRKFEGQIKHVTVSRNSAGEYFVSICTEVPDTVVPPKGDSRVLGIDMALDCLAVYSDGTSAEMPHVYRQLQKKLIHAQRALSRKKCGNRKKGVKASNNYRKQQRKIARIYRDIENFRKDFLDKESHRISENFDVVVVEDINLQTMAKHKKGKAKHMNHGKSVADIAFGEFRTMLAYKMARTGGKLVKADRNFPSSQLCSNCGFKNVETKQYWKVKAWTCPQCGMEHDLVINGVQHGRDFNAAKNLQQFYVNTTKTSVKGA